MTQEEFNNYPFSINTEVCLNPPLYADDYDKVVEIDFSGGYIGTERGYYVKFSEIKAIRN